MSKLYWLEKSNVEAVSASIEAILSKITGQNFDYVIGNVEFPRNQVKFHTLEEFFVTLCRKEKKLKNDRTLFISQEQSLELISVLLKEDHGDDDFPVSQVLDVYSNPEDPLHQKYLEKLKHSNLVNDKLLKNASENLELNASIFIIIDGQNDFLSLFEHFDQFKVQLEQSLDASMHENAQDFNLTIEEEKIKPMTLSENLGFGLEMTSKMKKIEAALRLLINSKDELALAKMVCTGPNSLLDHKSFTIVKKNSTLPLFQTIMSHAQKLKLGGKSYAPTESHVFAPFHKELTVISDLMDKLYNQLELEPEPCLRKILNILKKYLEVDGCEFFMDIYNKCNARKVKQNQTSSDMIKQVLDFTSTRPLGKINVHQLLGKIGQASPKILNFFTSPDLVVNEDTTKDIIDKTLTPKISKKKNDGKPRFQSTMAWAADTSPLVLKSDEKVPVRTFGVTAVMQVDSSPKLSKMSKIAEQAKNEAEQALKEAKAVNKEIKLNKAPKRSILADIKNAEKWTKQPTKKPKLEVLDENETKSTKKRTLDIKGEENATKPKETKPKKKSSKAQKPLLRGQMKMTSFLRV